MTKRRCLSLRCLESEVKETDVHTLGNQNVHPSPQEVELWVVPTQTLVRLWLTVSVCVLCWSPRPYSLLKITPFAEPLL